MTSSIIIYWNESEHKIKQLHANLHRINRWIKSERLKKIEVVVMYQTNHLNILSLCKEYDVSRFWRITEDAKDRSLFLRKHIKQTRGDAVIFLDSNILFSLHDCICILNQLRSGAKAFVFIRSLRYLAKSFTLRNINYFNYLNPLWPIHSMYLFGLHTRKINEIVSNLDFKNRKLLLQKIYNFDFGIFYMHLLQLFIIDQIPHAVNRFPKGSSYLLIPKKLQLNALQNLQLILGLIKLQFEFKVSMPALNARQFTYLLRQIVLFSLLVFVWIDKTIACTLVFSFLLLTAYRYRNESLKTISRELLFLFFF